MSVTGAHITLTTPALPGPLHMRIVVPEGPDVRRRIGTYAQVIAQAYSRLYGLTKCAWCGEEIATGRVFNTSEGAPRAYCSSSCFLASL